MIRTHIVLSALALLASASVFVGCSSRADAGAAASSADTSGSSCSDNLQATDGTPIGFSYQVQSSGGDGFNALTAVSSSLSISGAFGGSEQVTGVVLLFEFGSIDGIGAASLQSTQTLAFAYDGDGESGSWQAQAAPLPMFNDTAGGEANLFFYQFAISIDGTWLTDPVSQSHNFQFVPSQQAQGLCQGAPSGFGS